MHADAGSQWHLILPAPTCLLPLLLRSRHTGLPRVDHESLEFAARAAQLRASHAGEPVGVWPKGCRPAAAGLQGCNSRGACASACPQGACRILP